MIDTESPTASGMLAQASSFGAVATLTGSTIICGAYGGATVGPAPSDFMGVTGWDCGLSSVIESNPTQSPYPWFLTQVEAYNRMMGLNAAWAPHPVSAPHFGMYDTHVVAEAINTKTTNAQSREDSGDGFAVPMQNAMQHQSSDVGGRVNKWYIEGGSIVSVAVATGGAFASASNYYTQIAYSRPSAPYTLSATDSGQANGTFGTQSPLTVALNGSIKWVLTCDFNYLATMFVDQLSAVTQVPQHLGDVATALAVTSQSGTSLNVTSMTGALYPGATLTTGSALVVDGSSNPIRIAACPSNGCTATGAGGANTYTLSGTPSPAMSGSGYTAQATSLNMCQSPIIVAIDPLTTAAPVASTSFANRNYLKDNIHETGNNEIDNNQKSDWFNTEMTNGARTGNWARRYGVGVNDDVYLTNTYGNTSYYFNGRSQGGDVAPNNTYFPPLAQSIYVNMSAGRYSYADDSGIGDSTGPAPAAYPYLNDGEGYACPASGSASYGRVPAHDFAEPWDIQGNPHPTVGTGNAGAYDQGC